MPRRRNGFSLIELLVVMVVIAIMSALSLVALSSAKEKSRAMMCRSNMRQLAMAFHMYADENSDFLPWPGGEPDRANYNPHYQADWCAGGQPAEHIGNPKKWDETFGFHAEAGSVFSFVMSRPRMPYSETNKEVYSVYRCPSTGDVGEALRVNYAANLFMDPGQPFGDGRVGPYGVLKTSVVDPLQKVLLMNEDPNRLSSPGFAPTPTSLKGTPVMHQGKVNVSFMDLHIEALSIRFVESMQTEHADRYYNLGR
ncbi:MAG: prepilin-type N-terminal cleavage/methylation domain-containing protein [Verrucomicrobia bacterium]|nr:prepilin-type N-terminal cleavage/methylation domain-containing protein [Verrucomicrobiota bacterium]